MSGRFPAHGRIAIVGHAQSPAVRTYSEPLGLTALRTARAAVEDAGLNLSQIDGFVSSSLFPGSGSHAAQDGVSQVTSDWLARHLGAKPAYVAGFQGIGQITGSLSLAINALASGMADYVLLHRALHNPAGKYHDNPMTRAGGELQWGAPQGFFNSLPAIAMACNEYFQRFGATREALAHVVVEARKNGARNDWSFWRGKPLTVEAYLAEPMLNDPLCRLDCDIPVQGVGAFILTTADRAKDLPHKPVYVAGFANGYPRDHRTILHWTLDEMDEVGRDLSQRLWTSAGLGPRDIDLPQLYDGFSPFIYIWLEAMGFCPRGEAHRFILDGGIDSDRKGSLAVLSSGGAIGNGRLHGLPQLIECYRQLSGRAGEWQRAANTAVLAYSAPNFGGALAFTNEPS